MSTESVETRPRTVELELLVRDPDCFFVAASEEIGCAVELEDMVHRSDGRLLEYFTVRGAAPERVLESASDAPAIDEAHLVRETDDGGLFEFVVAGPCVTITLADAGAITRSVTASNGQGRVVAEVPSHVTIRGVVEQFTERHPGSELLAHRQRDRSLQVGSSGVGLLDVLTGRQEEALRTAYVSGYFEWPRDNGAEDCAAALGVSQPTFSQHLRAGERRLFERLFDSAGNP